MQTTKATDLRSRANKAVSCHLNFRAAAAAAKRDRSDRVRSDQRAGSVASLVPRARLFSGRRRRRRANKAPRQKQSHQTSELASCSRPLIHHNANQRRQRQRRQTPPKTCFVASCVFSSPPLGSHRDPAKGRSSLPAASQAPRPSKQANVSALAGHFLIRLLFPARRLLVGLRSAPTPSQLVVALGVGGEKKWPLTSVGLVHKARRRRRRRRRLGERPLSAPSFQLKEARDHCERRHRESRPFASVFSSAL